MANKKISQLPTKTTPAASDFIPIVDTAALPVATKKTTLANVLSAFNLVSTDDIGTPGGAASLDVGGKVPLSQLPAIAISDTFVVASQAALLALTAEVGDVAVRADLNKSFILAAEPASDIDNWVELLSSGIPASNILDGGNF